MLHSLYSHLFKVEDFGLRDKIRLTKMIHLGCSAQLSLTTNPLTGQKRYVQHQGSVWDRATFNYLLAELYTGKQYVLYYKP